MGDESLIEGYDDHPKVGDIIPLKQINDGDIFRIVQMNFNNKYEGKICQRFGVRLITIGYEDGNSFPSVFTGINIGVFANVKVELLQKSKGTF